jgi:hypothetical protein
MTKHVLNITVGLCLFADHTPMVEILEGLKAYPPKEFEAPPTLGEIDVLQRHGWVCSDGTYDYGGLREVDGFIEGLRLLSREYGFTRTYAEHEVFIFMDHTDKISTTDHVILHVLGWTLTSYGCYEMCL